MTVHGIHVTTPETGWCTAPVKHYRLWDCGVTWKHINTAPNVYDWSRLDMVVDGLIAQSATNLTYVIGATPLWDAKDPNLTHFAPWLGQGSNSQPKSNVHFQAFILKLVARYKGRIDSYQIWNEPQLKDFWGYDNWDALAEMTRIAYNAIKLVDPTAKVVAGPVIARPSSGGMRRGGRYLKALKAKNWPVDVYAAHFYPEIGMGPKRWREYARNWKSALTTLGAPKKPLWVTETNFNIFGGVLDDATINNYMSRVDVIAKNEGIRKVYWYCWNHSDKNLFGIPFATGTQGTLTLRRLLEENSPE